MKGMIEVEKPVNHLAQTGSLEDLIWSIMNDAESEAHIDRLIQSLNRDSEGTEDEQEKDEILEEIKEVQQFKNDIRSVRYEKTYIAIAIASEVATKKQDDRFSCLFKHLLLSMAEMRDAKDAIDNENLTQDLEKVYAKTVNNTSVAISKFLGLEVESCMACLFEKSKIMRRN